MIIFLLFVEFGLFAFMAFACYKLGYLRHSIEMGGAMGNIMRKRPTQKIADDAPADEFLAWVKDQLKTYQLILMALLDDKELKANNIEYRKFIKENPFYGTKRDNRFNGKPREANRA